MGQNSADKILSPLCLGVIKKISGFASLNDLSFINFEVQALLSSRNQQIYMF